MKNLIRFSFITLLLACAFKMHASIVLSPFNNLTSNIKANIFLAKAEHYIDDFNIDSTEFYLRLSLTEFRRHNNVLKEITTLIKISEACTYKRKFENAKYYLSQAELLLKKNKSTSCSNRIELAWGYYYNGISCWNESNVRLDRYIAGLERTKANDSAFFDAYLYQGINNYSLGNFSNAINAYSKALVSFLHRKQKSHLTFAYVTLCLSQTYAEIKKYKTAVDLLKKCIKIYSLIPYGCHLEYAQTLASLAFLEKDLGQFTESKMDIERAERLCLKYHVNDPSVWNSIYSGKASLSSIEGDYATSLAYYKKALEYGNITSYFSKINYLVSVINIAQANLKMGELSDALDVLNSNIINIKSNRPSLLGDFYYLLFEINCKKNKSFNSEEIFNLCINNYTTFFGPFYPSIGKAHLLRAKQFLCQNDLAKGINSLQHAEKIFKHSFSKRNSLLSECYQLYGDFYKINGDFNIALNFYQQSVCAASKTFQSRNIFDNPVFSDALSSLQLLSAMKSKAFALGEMAQEMTQPDRKIQYLTASLHSYQLADALISELKSGYTSHESRQFIATAENETYHQAITVAAELYALTQKEVYLESAFRFSEKNKSSVLLGSLKDEEVLSAAGIPASVQAYQKKLKQNMGLLENLIHEEEESNAPSAEKRKAYEDRLLTCRLELSRTHSEMEKRSPLYARLRYKQSSLPLSAIQTAIPANTVLIEYALAGNSVYSFLISSDTVMLKKVPYDSSFNTSLSDYRRSLSGCDLSAYAQEDYNRYIQSATFLYDRLILPFEDRIQNRAVILVPEDRLGYIPFEALLTKKPSGNGMDFNSLSYWITKNPVSYSYSVALLSTPDVLQKEISPEGKYLAVAPRYSGPVSKAQSRSYAEFTSRNDLHDLPAAQEEVNNICRYAETKTYCGREATEELFKKEAPRYPVLHLAMHAVVDNEQPLYSKLVFSAGDTTEDGLLNASEIMNLDLHARMVVLSACNTGFGKILKGEGVFSLARTFLYAGCRSVVMTLWSVEDLSSAKLMDRFYYHLSQKETKSVALQQAKLEYLKNADPSHAHPYFWAGYVSIGDTSPLLSPEKEKTPLRWPFYAGMGLFGFAFVFYFRKKVAALFV